MRRSILAAAVLGSLFVCSVLAALLVYFQRVHPSLPGDPSSVSSYAGGYVVTLWEGKVAIRQTGVDTPCRVYDLPATMLSDYDREALLRGVACETLEAAERLAGDYVG